LENIRCAARANARLTPSTGVAITKQGNLWILLDDFDLILNLDLILFLEPFGYLFDYVWDCKGVLYAPSGKDSLLWGYSLTLPVTLGYRRTRSRFID